MRVALYHNLPPGGALRVVLEFCRRADPDIEIDLFTLDFGRSSPFSRSPDDGYPDLERWVRTAHTEPVDSGFWGTASAGVLDRLGHLSGIRKAERRLARLINRGRYDVVFVHPCWFSQTPSILGDLRGPTVYYMHEVRRATFEPEYAPRPKPSAMTGLPRWWMGGVVEKRLQRRDIIAAAAPDHIWCNSEFSAGAIEAAYSRQAEVVYPGVDTALFALLKVGDAALPAASQFVVSVGGLERFKQPLRVVEAMGRISESERPKLALVYQRCDQEYRSEVLATADRVGVVVEEHRNISDDHLADLYRAAAATVLAADREPFGLVPLESMACGTPVVATDDGGYRETVVDGKSGLLVRPTAEGLSDGIRQVLDGALEWSPEECREHVVTAWSWDAAVKRQVRKLEIVVGSFGRYEPTERGQNGKPGEAR